MVKKYRDNRQSGVTGSREEARANRKLQLIVSTSHPGERGKTLLEKMEERLDKTLQERRDLTTRHDLEESDQSYDDLLKNEGKVQGMLQMLGIMRSTGMKVELTRAKARMAHAQHDHNPLEEE